MQLNMFGKGRTLRWAITFTCEIAFIFFGYDQGVMGGLVTNEDLLRVLKNPSDSALGIMLSIYNLGCFTGCFINWVIGDGIGRRKTIYFAMGWIIIGATLQASAFSLAHLMVGRFVTGIGTGIETSTVPVYQSKLCEASKRGRLVCSEVLFVGLGLVISAFFDYGMAHVDGPLVWRLPIAFQLVFAFVVCFMTLGIPESPRYLYRKDRGEEAIQVLCGVYDKDPNHESVMREQADIIEALQTERSAEKFQWRNIFKKDEVQTGKRVLLAYGMQFMNQMGGINLVVYYMPTVLQRDVGLSHQVAVLLGAVINLMFLIGSIFPTTLADRVGRRKPMMLGSLGCGLAMMCISILLSFKDTSVSHQTSIGGVACFFLFMLFYGATVACVPWAYVPEILPLHARSKGSAIAVSSNWIWNFFIVMITPIFISNIQWKAYIIFMCLNFAFIPLVYFCYPETANLTLEEVDLLYTEHGAPARKVAERFQKQIKEHGRGIMEDVRTPAIKTDASHIEEIK